LHTDKLSVPESITKILEYLDIQSPDSEISI